MSLDIGEDRFSAAEFIAPRSRPRAVMAPNVLLFVALFAVALLPVLVTPIPAMVDYVNHLARMYVLATAGTPTGSPFYQVTSAFYPNLAMDLIVPRLAPLLGVALATRAFLLVTQVLIVSGAAILEYAVKGKFGISGFCALLILYSVPFAWGFLNFEFALGIALWGSAGWLALRQRPWAMRIAVHSVVVAVLLVSHLFALGLYGFTLGVHELWAARTRSIRATLATMATLAAPALVAGGYMAISGATVGQAVNRWGLGLKPIWPFFILNGYSAMASAIGMTILLLMVHALIRRRALAFRESGAYLVIGFALLYLAVPARLLDTEFVDIRVLVAAVLVVPAFVDVAFSSERVGWVVTGTMAALILAAAGIAAYVWRSYQSDYGAMITSFARLDKGASVLVANSGEGAVTPMQDLTEFPIYHAPTLAVHYADAFVPTLFTSVGKQPIGVDAAHQRLTYSGGGPVAMTTLKAILEGTAAADTPRFVRSWRRDFDYLYVVGPREPNPLPDVLEALDEQRRFTLYRIRKSGQGSPTSLLWQLNRTRSD